MNRSAFTFIEVLAILMVLVVGMFGALALIRYGVAMAREAQAKALALPTAQTLLYDPQPLGAAAADWAKTGSTWKGYVNGLWAERTVSAASSSGNGLSFATVTVAVSWGNDQDAMFTLRERICFHGN